MPVAEWLNAFNRSMLSGSAEATAALFHDGGFWRDYLALDWNLRTFEGTESIRKAVERHAASAGLTLAPIGDGEEEEGFISVQTRLGRGRGYVRLEDGKCLTLLTVLEELEGHEEPLGGRRRSGLEDSQDGSDWKHTFETKTDRFANGESPYVLIVGGGQAGLALGARLEMQGVPYLIVDKHPNVGDQWRSRYRSLTLHDPVWYDHMPYVSFPDFWPIYTPKDKMGDWLESYARMLELAVWTGTECVAARRDRQDESWDVVLKREGQEIRLRPSHLVMAVGNAGFPRMAQLEDQEIFAGAQIHSSQYSSGDGMAGKRVIVIGANNSAHDIAADLVQNGARPVMIQRSSTLIVRQSTMTDRILKPIYSQEAVDAGITTDLADLLLVSNPLRVQERRNRRIWDSIRADEAEFYDRLAASGFRIDFGTDGTGLMKYQRTASGYYIDCGACEMVMDGRIDIRSGTGIARLVPEGMELETGEVIEADMIVHATGFGTMEEWVARLIDPETAEKVGKCWGYGSGTKGDPGPWEGELRNMWKPTAQKGLWFMGGNLSQARFYSALLGLQLKGRYENLVGAEG